MGSLRAADSKKIQVGTLEMRGVGVVFQSPIRRYEYMRSRLYILVPKTRTLSSINQETERMVFTHLGVARIRQRRERGPKVIGVSTSNDVNIDIHADWRVPPVSISRT